jgi:hypothetical protein
MKFKINKYNNNLLLLTLLLLIILIITTYSINFNIIDTFTNNDTTNMKSYSVIFAGAIKNGEKYIKNNLDNIDKCGKKFKNYAVIIYENDSSDNTIEILNANKKENYHYIFEKNVNINLRTDTIAHARNSLLNKANILNKDNSYDFLVMLDLDDVTNSGKFVETIDTCFNYTNDWDVLTGNQTGGYYDIWAFRKKGLMEYDCWKEYKKAVDNGMPEKEAHTKYVGILGNFDQSDNLIEVDSAFGGIAIYKLNSKVTTCRYKGTDEDGNEICEHVPFNECIKKNGGKIFINTKFLIY